MIVGLMLRREDDFVGGRAHSELTLCSALDGAAPVLDRERSEPGNADGFASG